MLVICHLCICVKCTPIQIKSSRKKQGNSPRRRHISICISYVRWAVKKFNLISLSKPPNAVIIPIFPGYHAKSVVLDGEPRKP